ncbi:MAG: O-antigen ligase family protein, partial [Anaerolineales bacterium]|nr:O-antigen ligase family protein [Anaerolineales bacterium]
MRKVESLFILSLIIPASVILFAIPMGWLIFTYRGPIGVVEGMSGIVEPRGTALYLLIVLTLALSRRQYAADIAEKRRMGIVALMALAILFFTLSRMAGFTALVLLALAFVKPHRAGRALLGVAAAALLGAAIVLSVPFLQDRFFSNPSADIWSTLSSLRLAGRDLSWRVTFENALRSPLVGWGPGSARLTVATFHKAADVTEFQPHNEYLQVFHDTGIIGLGLLLAGYVPLLFRFHKEWKKNHLLKNEPRAMRNMAAFFSLIAILLPSVTSNPMHFAFITEPVARVKQISGIAVKPASPFRRFSVLHS